MVQRRKVFSFEILVYLLILLITKLLSFNFSPQEFIRKKVRKSFALHLGSLLPNLPPSSSNLLIVERCISAAREDGGIFLPVLTRESYPGTVSLSHTSLAGAYAVLYRALSKLSSLPGEITVVTDAFTCYPPAIQPLRLILR